MATANLIFSLLGFSIIFVLADGQKCLQGWQLHAGSCYGFGGSAVSWGDAQEMCYAFNAKLAEIETDAENTFLKNLVKSKQATFTWLGSTDIFNLGTWEWVSTGKEIYSFVDWAPNQPDSNGAENCLVYYSGVNYQWNDYSCDHTAHFLCEAAPLDVIVG